MRYVEMCRTQRRFISRLCIHTLYQHGSTVDGSHLMTMIRMLRDGKLQIEMAVNEATGMSVSWIQAAPEWAALLEEMSQPRVLN